MPDTIHIWGVNAQSVLAPVEVKRPTHPPSDCKFSTEDLECLGCGVKLGRVRPGCCYLVDGATALK